MSMNTLHEIAVERANKQPGMVDAVTEDAPVLAIAKFQPSTHGLHNVAEKLTNIVGPGFVEANAPLPYMSADTDLVHTDLCVMGGTIEVPTLTAIKFGGPQKYFARKQDALLRKSGMDTEVQLILKNWLAAARAEKNIRNAGATGKGHFMVAVRFDPLGNTGLYDADQFESGRFFRIDLPYGGSEHHLSSPQYHGVLGYSITYRSIFGWQILDAKRTCSAIVNIDEGKAPTANQIDDMLADVRATSGNTYIITSPRGQIFGINPHKQERVQMTINDGEIKTTVATWNGIPIITSYNIANPIDNIKA